MSLFFHWLARNFQVRPVNRVPKKTFPSQRRCRRASPRAASTARRYTTRRPPNIPSVNTLPDPPPVIARNLLLFSFTSP